MRELLEAAERTLLQALLERDHAVVAAILDDDFLITSSPTSPWRSSLSARATRSRSCSPSLVRRAGARVLHGSTPSAIPTSGACRTASLGFWFATPPWYDHLQPDKARSESRSQ